MKKPTLLLTLAAIGLSASGQDPLFIHYGSLGTYVNPAQSARHETLTAQYGFQSQYNTTAHYGALNVPLKKISLHAAYLNHQSYYIAHRSLQVGAVKTWNIHQIQASFGISMVGKKVLFIPSEVFVVSGPDDIPSYISSPINQSLGFNLGSTLEWKRFTFLISARNLTLFSKRAGYEAVFWNTGTMYNHKAGKLTFSHRLMYSQQRHFARWDGATTLRIGVLEAGLGFHYTSKIAPIAQLGLVSKRGKISYGFKYLRASRWPEFTNPVSLTHELAINIGLHKKDQGKDFTLN